jgi:hypothetical protein
MDGRTQDNVGVEPVSLCDGLDQCEDVRVALLLAI